MLLYALVVVVVGFCGGVAVAVAVDFAVAVAVGGVVALATAITSRFLFSKRTRV